jgi:hypothetical protein
LTTGALRPAHSAYSATALSIHAAAQHIEKARTNGGIAMKLLKFIFPRPVSRRDAEIAYLSASASLYDLEMREREIARGKFAAY